MKQKGIFYVCAVLATAIPLQVYAEILVANAVPIGTKKVVRTVPAGKVFKLYNATFSGGTCGGFNSTVFKQRILKSGNPIIGDMTTSLGGSFQLNFNPVFVFRAGETIEVENGDGECVTNFTLQGITANQ